MRSLFVVRKTKCYSSECHQMEPSGQQVLASVHSFKSRQGRRRAEQVVESGIEEKDLKHSESKSSSQGRFHR